MPQKAALADCKSYRVWRMMIAAGLMWARAEEKCEKLKMVLPNIIPCILFNQNWMESTKFGTIYYYLVLVDWLGWLKNSLGHFKLVLCSYLILPHNKFSPNRMTKFRFLRFLKHKQFFLKICKKNILERLA